MTRKIFRTSLLVGLAALALSAGLFSWALVRHFTAKVYEELMVEVRLAAQGVRLGGRDYLEAVSSPARLTWIGGDGTVLFDTAAQAEGMRYRFLFGAEQEFYLFKLDENGEPTKLP